jgi:hypothetical protein
VDADGERRSAHPAPNGSDMLAEIDALIGADPLDGQIVGRVELLEPPPVVAPVDPWAHRRGEPRLFAFFWTFYVLLAVAGSLTWVARFTTITAGTYGPAARVMLVAVAVGMIVLWPMTRLSQASPRNHPVVSSFADLLVVQAPVQIVVWPLMVLANWPQDIVVGLAAMFATWGVLVGGLVALGLSGPDMQQARDGRLWSRAGWMCLALLLGFGAVLLQWLLTATGRDVPAWILMSSPVTAIPALTGRGLSGPSAPVSQVQWDTIIGTLSLAVLLWSASVARYGLVSRGRDG